MGLNMSQSETDSTIREKVRWYKTHRNKIWGGVLFVVGVFGGNVDRVNEFVNKARFRIHEDVELVKEKLTKLEERLSELEYKTKKPEVTRND